MKIINEPDWDSNHLRALVKETAKRFGADTTESVRIVYGRRATQYSGLATLAARWGNWVRVRVPRPSFTQGYAGSDGNTVYREVQQEFNSEVFAGVLLHEFAHNKGVRHKDMLHKFDTEWAKEFKVEVQPKKVPAVIDLKAIRHTLTLNKIKEKETKLKRVQNSLKKLYARKKYYEKRLI